MKSCVRIICAFLLFLVNGVAHADMYKCAQMVYKDGMLKKYEYKGNTWGANTKKHGVFSSTTGSTTETTTASVDPGVSTKQLLSSAQYSSSWGECSAIDYEITQEFRSDYIKQNIVEIKKQISVGDGYHLASLAFLSGCKQIDRAEWTTTLQKNFETLYDASNEVQFDKQLQQLIHSDRALASQCKTLG